MAEETTKEISIAERMVNVGVEVQMSFGPIKVKDLSLEKVITLAESLAIVFGSMEGEKEGMAMVLKLVKNPETLAAVKKIAAGATSLPVEQFNELPLVDWLKLSIALKQVINWGELQELFFQLVPRESLTALKSKTP